MKHATLSPSASHRWLNCPGSIQANADRPWEMSSYALEGTSAHALLELCQRLGTDPEEHMGQVLEKGLMPVDGGMVDAVGHAMDWVRGYMADNPKAKIFIEQPVYPGKTLNIEDEVLWGTPDIRISNFPVESVVMDYKHGIGIPVAVKDNSQIKLYHVGQRTQLGRYQRYRSVVIQPRVPKRRPVQEHVDTDKELMQWVEKKVMPVIPIALSGNAPRLAGDWCKYCAASGNCPAQMKAVFEDAAREFGKVKDPKRLTPAQLAGFLDKVPMVMEAVNSLKAVAISAVHAGVKVPGYEAAWTSAHRIWADEEKANTWLTKKGLLPKERFEVKLLSPSKAEKVLREKKIIGKRVRGQTYVDPLEDFIAYGENNPTIKKVG
jgi:hypothetical protein